MTNFIRYNNTEIGLAPDKTVIKAKEYATYLESKDILKASEERARQQEEQATTALSGMISEAMMNASRQAKTEKITQMIATISGSLQHLEKMEQAIVDLVIQSVRKVINDLDDDERIYQIVRAGIKQLGESQRIIVRLHPEALEKYQERLIALKKYSHFLELMPDHQLNFDDCILESDIGIINASLEAQLKAIEEALRQYQ
ncbi:MAG: type III secretion system stator protein SctL [bacterium]